MKSGWAIKKLGEVCEASNGLWKGKKGPFRKIAVLRSTNFTKECQLDLSDVVYIDVESRLLPRKLLREGDIIIEKSGGGPRQPVGRPVYFDKNVGEYSFCNFTSMLKVADSDVLPLYLHRCLYYLYVSGATESLQSYTIGLRNLDFKGYLDLDIPIPPLAEQKRIVAKIDAAFEKIDKLKANAERNLANAKELFQSALDEAMRPKDGWVEKRLGEVCKTTSGGTPIKSHREYYEDGNIPWLRSGEVCCKDIIKSEMFITELGLRNSSAKIMPKNTVLIAMYGATAAQTGILRFESATNQAICGILPDKYFEPEFLYYYFRTIQRQLAARAQGGAQPNISQEKIKDTLVPILPLSEQREIVKHLDLLAEKIKILEQNYTKQIADCVEMRQAVLREAFEGRL